MLRQVYLNFSFSCNFFAIFFKMPKDHPFITLAKGPGGCVLKMDSFGDVQNYFCTNIAVGSKKFKIMPSNIWMVPKRNKYQ